MQKLNISYTPFHTNMLALKYHSYVCLCILISLWFSPRAFFLPILGIVYTFLCAKVALICHVKFSLKLVGYLSIGQGNHISLSLQRVSESWYLIYRI